MYDSWCCCNYWIWIVFSGFIIRSYYYAREMADNHFMFGDANGNSREASRLYTERCPQSKIQSHKLFTELCRFWTNVCTLLHRRRIAEGLGQLELPIQTFTYWEESKKIRESIWEEFQLLKVWAFPFLENYQWIIILTISDLGSSSSYTSWSSCKDGICCKHTVYS
jgi:hypothetical protein